MRPGRPFDRLHPGRVRIVPQWDPADFDGEDGETLVLGASSLAGWAGGRR